MKLAKKTIPGIVLSLLWIISAHAQPTDNVVAYFPFNGNANDVTGNGKNGSVSGAILTTDRLGKANAAYYFNGTSNLIYLPNNLLPGNTAYTISLWFKSYGVGTFNGQVLLDLRGQYNSALSYYSNNPTYQRAVSFYIAAPSPSVFCNSANNAIQDAIWYHVVATYASNIMQLYINGNLVSTCSQTPPGGVSGYNNVIGKDYVVGLNRGWFYGAIDEVILYKRSLTSTEIQAIYNKELTQSELPELYAPIKYSVDASGNRTGRNVIALKSASVINIRPDSIGKRTKLVGEASLSDLDSLKYTDLDQKVKIYPNPTKGQLQTELSGFDFTQKSGIYVYSSSGTLLQQKVPASPSDIIDLSGYASGVYIMRIIIGDKVSEWKIIKE